MNSESNNDQDNSQPKTWASVVMASIESEQIDKSDQAESKSDPIETEVQSETKSETKSEAETETKVEQLEQLPVIDICINLAGKRFSNKKREELLQRAADANVRHAVLCSTNETATKSHLRMIEYYRKNRCAVSMVMTAGVHPHDAKTWRKEYSARVFENTIVKNPEIKVVGECGLDYDRMFSTIEEQDICFREQIRLAKKLNLPLFLHERKAHRQFIATLEKETRILNGRDNGDPVQVNGVIHCFTGNYDQLITYLRLGLHVGITGWVGTANDNRNSNLVEALKRIGTEPDNLSLLRSRLMVETDTPFLSPVSRRSPNEPANTQIVLRTVAEYLRVSYEELAPEVYENTVRFFRL